MTVVVVGTSRRLPGSILAPSAFAVGILRRKKKGSVLGSAAC